MFYGKYFCLTLYFFFRGSQTKRVNNKILYKSVQVYWFLKQNIVDNILINLNIFSSEYDLRYQLL